MICLSCQADNQPSEKACRLCGTPLLIAAIANPNLQPIPAESEIICSNCQYINGCNWYYCLQCGARLYKTSNRDGAQSSNIVSCESCGRINITADLYCVGCGLPLPINNTLTMGAPKVASVRKTNPRLRLINREGEREGEVYKLNGDRTVIGRMRGDIRFPQDNYMSNEHAYIICIDSRYLLVDEKSRNGTFIQVDGETDLKHGDIILVGKQLFCFEIN
ncbi:MAG: FHA domain-containing protein [Acidobacteriota bacterium]